MRMSILAHLFRKISEDLQNRWKKIFPLMMRMRNAPVVVADTATMRNVMMMESAHAIVKTGISATIERGEYDC